MFVEKCYNVENYIYWIITPIVLRREKTMVFA